MATTRLPLAPSNTGAPFAVILRQPDASPNRATVILRARVQSRIGLVLFDTFLEIGRSTIEAPLAANGAGDRVVAVGAIPGALEYEAECNVADLEGIEIQTGPYLALTEPLTWINFTAAADPGGLEQFAQIDLVPIGQGAVVVGVEQADASVSPCRIVIEGQIGGTWVEIGRRLLAAPGPSGPGRRVVALLAIPGVSSYRVRAKSADAARPYLQIGPYRNLSLPFAWLSGGVPVPPPGAQQPETITYAAPNGNDSTGQRGSYDRPFRTIAAALAVMLDGDALHLAPGDYDAVAPADLPAGLAVFSIVGQGQAGTVRILSSSGPAFELTPGPAPRQINLSSLTIETTSPGSTAAIVQGPGGGTGNASTLRADGCRFVAGGAALGLLAENLAAVELAGCLAPNFGIRVLNCNGGTCLDHVSGDLTVRIDDPVPGHVTRGIFSVRGGTFGILALEGEAWIETDRDVDCSAVNGGSGLGAAGPTASLAFAGQAALVDLYLPASPGGSYVFDQSWIANLQINSQIPAPNTTTVSARGAVIQEATLSSPGGGDLVLDTRGGRLGVAGSTFGPACFWDRHSGGANAVLLPPGPTAVAFGAALGEFPFPPGTAVAYLVTPIVVAPPALGTDQTVVTSQDHTGCTISSGYAAPINGNISWFRVG